MPAVYEGQGGLAFKSLVGYPKPVDLYVGRLKPGETWVEDRTDAELQIARMTCA